MDSQSDPTPTMLKNLLSASFFTPSRSESLRRLKGPIDTSLLLTSIARNDNIDSVVLKPQTLSGISAAVPGASILVMEVIDTGIGLSLEQIRRLFKPFSQADDSSTRKYGGTGLGLGIVRGLVRLMGGDINIKSELGNGSNFVVMIPIKFPKDKSENKSENKLENKLENKQENKQENKPENKNVQETANNDSPFSKTKNDPEKTTVYETAKTTGINSAQKNLLPLSNYRILVVDDGIVNQLVAEAKLRDAGAEVVVASNGRLAIDKVTESKQTGRLFDAVLMDMQMPIMDGFEATRELRRLGFKLPILALTANFGNNEDSFQAGCDAVLTKPFNRDELINTILKFSKRKKKNNH
jgi:CheY-like chemotaxis protein